MCKKQQSIVIYHRRTPFICMKQFQKPWKIKKHRKSASRTLVLMNCFAL
jgi:hypothetical protein